MANQLVFSGKSWDVATKYTQSGMCISEFSISVYKGKNKETQKAEYFNVNCKAFGQIAENIGNQVQKQDEIIVIGRQDVETWEKDGKKNYKNVLIVDEIGKSISKFSGTNNNANANSNNGANNVAKNSDMSSFGTEVFPEEEIPF